MLSKNSSYVFFFFKKLFYLFLAALGFSCSRLALCFDTLASVAAALGLSCPGACGILVPHSGIEPTSAALEGRFLTTGPPWKSLFSSFIIVTCLFLWLCLMVIFYILIF